MSFLTFSVLLAVLLLVSIGTFRYSPFGSVSSSRFSPAFPRVGRFGVPRWEEKSGMSADSPPDLIDRVFHVFESTISWIVWNFQTFRPRTILVVVLDVLSRLLSAMVLFLYEVKMYIVSLFSCSPPQSQYFIYVQPQTKYCEAYNNYYQVPVQTSLFDKCLAVLMMLTTLSSITFIKLVRAKRSISAVSKQPQNNDTFVDLSPTNSSLSDLPQVDGIKRAKEWLLTTRDRTPLCTQACSRSFILYGRCREHDPKIKRADHINFGRVVDAQSSEDAPDNLGIETPVGPSFVKPLLPIKVRYQPKPKVGGRNYWKTQRASRIQIQAAKHRARIRGPQLVWKQS